MISLLRSVLLLQAFHSAPPYAPKDAQTTFQLPDGLAIELIAAEPLVQDPVAIAWDARGRLYVAEMGDYPALATGGRIRLLEDRDKDGHYETSHLFAEGLPYPTSVLPWREGVLVAAAPDILYLADTDDDGQGDIRQSLLTGFGEGNQQLRVNGLTYGLDNWIYGANGRSNGAVRFTDDPDGAPVSLANHDFRFNLTTRRFEQTAGFSQFGITFDNWGNQFLSWNTTPIRQVVIDRRYTDRNPLLISPEAVVDISDPADAGRIYAITAPSPRFNREPTGYFNASCGIAIDRGGIFTGDVAGSAFICEPLGNLVHRKVLKPNGITFRGVRSPREATSEFLASSDPWFHPVNLASGPDGALYVVDFYREWVEHPQFVPDDLEGEIDFANGAGHGRIWRIRPAAKKLGSLPNLSQMTDKELVEQLSSSTGWIRMTAQRLLVERKASVIADNLRHLVTESPSPLARLHALWTLDGLSALDDATLLRALRDEHPELRRTAVLLSEPRLASRKHLRELVYALTGDAELRVRFQVACSLGALSGVETLRALTQLSHDAHDPWMRTAILSAIGDATLEFMQELSESDLATANRESLICEVATLIGIANKDEQLRQLADWLSRTQPSIAPSVLLGLGRGLSHRAVRLQPRLVSLEPRSNALLENVMESAIIKLANRELPEEQRLLAAELLGYDEGTVATSALQQALRDPLPSVRQAAVHSLDSRPDDVVASIYLEVWEESPSAVRRDIALSLLKSPARATNLLTAIEDGKIQRTELDLDCRKRLLDVLPEPLATKASQLLVTTSTDRQSVIDRYRSQLAEHGDPKRGEAHFTKNCAACHRIHGKGPLVGPELSGLVTKTPEQLLVDILDPSREVLPNFIGFLAVTSDGSVHSGLLASESPTAITLRKQEGGDQVLLREEIEEFRATGKSLMPEGFEENLSPAELSDLIAFLRAITRE